MPDSAVAVMVIGDAASVHVRTRAAALAAEGFGVTLVSESAAACPGVTIASPAPGGPVARMIALVSLIRGAAPGLVHVHYAASLGAWLFLACGPKVPLVVSVMGGDVLDDEQHPLPGPARWLTRTLLRSADAVTVKSDLLARRVAALGVDPARIHRVLWGIDPDVFHRVADDGLRTAFGLTAEDRVILSPRMLRPLYNIHLLIEAMAVLRPAHPQVRLVILEYGADAAYANTLRRRITELGLDDCIIWGGTYPPQAMARMYSLAEITLSLPPSDGFPQTILESLACGTPCIVTRLDRYREILTENETVVMTDLTPAAIAETIAALLDDRARAQSLAQQGRALIARLATLPVEAQRVGQLYHALIKAGPKRPGPSIPVRVLAGLVMCALALRQTLRLRRLSCAV